MNETNADGPTDSEQILWTQLAERDEVNAQLRAEVERLTKERDEARGILSQLNSDYEKQSPMSRPPLAAQVDYIASVVSERDSLRAQLAEREEDRKVATELLAKEIYEGMRKNDEEGQRFPWFPHGNSLKQEEARHKARAAIRAARAQPEDGK